LRALEGYVKDHMDTAEGHFPLAYHYLVLGSKNDAVNQFKEVVRVQPNDKLSAELVKALTTPTPTPTVATAGTGQRSLAPAAPGPVPGAVGASLRISVREQQQLERRSPDSRPVPLFGRPQSLRDHADRSINTTVDVDVHLRVRRSHIGADA